MQAALGTPGFCQPWRLTVENCVYSLAICFGCAHCRGNVWSVLRLPCRFAVWACLSLEKFFAEERTPVMLAFKFSASLLHVLFPDACCTCLKVYGSALRVTAISHISRSRCLSERVCRQGPVLWDCRTGLGLTLRHQGLKEMLGSSYFRWRYTDQANLESHLDHQNLSFQGPKSPVKKLFMQLLSMNWELESLPAWAPHWRWVLSCSITQSCLRRSMLSVLLEAEE